MSIDSLIPAGVNLGGWWDGYDKSTVSFVSGDYMSSWADKSDAGEDLVNSRSTASEHPQWSEDYYGMRFTANTGQWMHNTTFNQDWSGVTVMISFTSRGDPDVYLLISQDNSSSYGDFSFQMRKDASNDNMDFEFRIDKNYSPATTANVVGGWDTDEKRVATFSFSNDGDYRRIRVRGHASATDSGITDYYDSGEVAEADNMSGTDASYDNGLIVGATYSSSRHVTGAVSSDNTADLDIHEIILLDGGMPGADTTARGVQLAVLEDYMLHHGPPKSPAQSPPGIGLGFTSRR